MMQQRQPTAISVVRPYAETLAMVAASTLVGLSIVARWGNSAVDLLYLPAVLAAAGFYGVAPGVLAAISSALAFNYFFTAPVGTFHVDNPEDIATVIMLFLVAMVTSQLAARMRSSERAAAESAARNATIAGLARALLSTSDERQVGAVACREVGRLFDCNAVLLTGREPAVVAARPDQTLMPGDYAAAAWAIQSDQPAGRSTRQADATEWLFLPLGIGNSAIGAIGLARDDGTLPFADCQKELLDNLVDQVALALERARLEGEARSFEATRERDRMRSALLLSIGQDVGPRLSAITTAVQGLQREGRADRGLLASLVSQATKLQRYLASLLDVGTEDQKPVEVGDVTIDLFHRRVSRGGEAVHLTPKEYAVVAELAKHPGRVLSHAHLLRTAWGPAHEHQTDYLRVAVRALRQKLEQDPAMPRLIVNEPAVGYRLAT